MLSITVRLHKQGYRKGSADRDKTQIPPGVACAWNWNRDYPRFGDANADYKRAILILELLCVLIPEFVYFSELIEFGAG